MEFTDLTVLTNLFIAFLGCNDEALTRTIPPKEAAYCAVVYETLKQEVANGDYTTFIEWREENEPIVRQWHEDNK